MVTFAFMFTLHYAIDLYQNVHLQRSAENTSSLGDKMVMFACMLTLHHVDDRYQTLPPFTATDALTAEAPGIRLYEILPSVVADDAIRRVIQDVRTSVDIQKLCFTGKSSSRLSLKKRRPLIATGTRGQF